MSQIIMNPIHGTIIKGIEISLFYPLYSIINYQHVNNTSIYKSINTMKTTTGFYRGIQFNLLYLPINKYVDLQIYKKFDSSIEAALLSSSLKIITYPLSTCEVYYLLHNKLPNMNKLYNGFSFYYISNTLSYLLWFNSLAYYNKQFTIKNYNLKNAIVGLISGLTVDIIMNPFRVLKTNYQTTNKIRINFKDIKFIDRGLKLRLLLSCLQSSFFNMLILWK